jgi:hypothetical protein
VEVIEITNRKFAYFLAKKLEVPVFMVAGTCLLRGKDICSSS